MQHAAPSSQLHATKKMKRMNSMKRGRLIEICIPGFLLQGQGQVVEHGENA